MSLDIIIDNVKSKDSKSEAALALVSHSETIRSLQPTQWLELKLKVREFVSMSKAEMEEIRKTPRKDVVVFDGDLDLGDKGEVLGNLKNCSKILEFSEGITGAIKHNSFLQRPCIVKEVPFLRSIQIKEGGFVELDDDIVAQLRVWLADEYAQFSKESIIDSIVNVSQNNRFNPLLNKLEKCWEQWDGKPRLDTWLFDYCNATYHDDCGVDREDEAKYIKAVGACWMISAVARAADQGCKVDNMLILEGIQGGQKSSFIEDLSLGYFLELTTSINKTKDVVDLMFGKWIVEMPELKALKGDDEGNKAFLTKRSDKERLSYARFSKDFPRRCVFIGTTNDDKYLRDSTGNRRYWPVKVGICDRKKLAKDIQHLWGEAYFRYLKNEKWWLEDESIISVAQQIQGIKQEIDEMSHRVQVYCEQEDFIMSVDVWKNVFKGQESSFDKKSQMRVGSIMTELGYERKKRRINGVPTWGYVPAVPAS